MKTHFHSLLVGVGLLLAAAGTFFLVHSVSVSKKGVKLGAVPEAKASCRDRDCLPALNLRTLDGKAVSAESLRGKIVMVNFWATWCRPCVGEMPALQAVYQRHGTSGLVILGVVMEQSPDEKIHAFLAQHGVTYPIVRSTPEIERLFGNPEFLPTSFLYDRDGTLRALWKSAIPERELESEVGGLVATSP
ncbi:MAG: TlpA family protein disulfide reductase [Deltaproteobacteria bacterium]|nr:TlpA family protein disulfide reductase [Deltaproteobacteria bacterium]